MLIPALLLSLAAQRGVPAAEPAPAPPPAEPAPATEPPPPPPAPAEPSAVTDAEDRVLNARGLDGRMRALADLVAIDLKRLPGDHRAQKFAVVPFENVGAQAQERQLGLVVSDLVVTNLARDHNLPVVERAALGKILDEQALGQSGAVDEKQAANVGKVSGARALVIGQVADTAEGFRVSVRAVDVESAIVISSHEAALPADELIAFSANAVVLKSKSGALFRSMVLPGWGQTYNDEPIKGAFMGGITGAFAIGTLVTFGVGFYNGYILYPSIGTRPEDKKDPAAASDATVATRNTANALFLTSSVLAGATVVAWAINALDAYISGHDVESMDAALARN